MRKYSRLSWLLLCVLMLCISGCGGSGGSAADPMGTATVQFIDETGAVLYPEEGGGLFGFVIDPLESRQLIVKVTNARSDGTSAPVVHEKVTFTLLTPQNGGRVTMVKEYTDSSGRAVGMYTAGNNFEIDNVRATTDAGASAECSVYKTGALLGKKVASVTASSTEVVAGQTSTITASVTDGYGNPVSGEPVLFTIPTNESGARFEEASGTGVASIQVTTDVSGDAVAVYYAGDDEPGQTVYDTVRAAIANGSAKYVEITRSGGQVEGYTLTLTADPDEVTVPAGGGSFDTVLTATIVDQNGNPVSGVTVNITDSSGGSATVTTGTDGKGIIGYTVSNITAGSVAFIAEAPSLGISDDASVTVNEMES